MTYCYNCCNREATEKYQILDFTEMLVCEKCKEKILAKDENEKEKFTKIMKKRFGKKLDD